MPDLTLNGASLTDPMIAVDPAVLPWEATQYRLRYECGPVSAYGLVTDLTSNGSLGRWRAFCLVAEGDGLDAYADTAEQARAAVEEHIAAHVDSLLKQAVRHG